MTLLSELVRYDGKHVVVTGCGSGIGAEVTRALGELGARVTGLDIRPPDRLPDDFIELDLADPESVDRAARAVDGPVDALFNVAGVSSGIGNPLLVVRINFLGTRQFTEALDDRIPAGGSITSVSSLAASGYRENRSVTAGLVRTRSVDEGLRWCAEHPEALADGGYRLSKEAMILYGMSRVAELGARGVRINCTAPGVTQTPILDQLRSAYGQQYLDSFTTPLGRNSDAAEQASLLVFLGGAAASYVTGQVVWADGGILAQREAALVDAVDNSDQRS
ncbi:coniferyl-alcohol dehydrogenase [Mycolicibacterium fortuitum]|uniref:Coniferyl-alcohol dehydrogenase n=3 Tax=Mycolicibacterium fortuitum TaxID=1766 RepID=A0AAE4VKG1_MYCFO|nr:coniferyl-alcohol dehydrogenase [Mycolicibacterium fortuitum]AIY47602.1 3-alpha-hydroxysteroid dehydrogenase [Mycobacterium sp. VKM Ac-1817D]CRL82232.1 3-alpha-hydroxysteroid dehydrogenase [Mycolicibacter nonchromogenicus]EJZ16091.1 3-alpha-hydroxysteroid dehydrogenase [Mycolicibacterium fortuitum subsp. fortuitum DSM 46621 = ATCC 6841 = JCM 6387]MBP3085638.1 coniferyl-alcohol dehydrogenase [Mycolicibacterium fortuitum]MCV7140574.1 coniferyl-alcohol dehydrogenase [Mycolicibacterium fortuitu